MRFILQFHDTRFEVENLLTSRRRSFPHLLQLLVECDEILRIPYPFAAQFLGIGRSEVSQRVTGLGIVEDKLEIRV